MRRKWTAYFRAAISAFEMALRQNVMDGFIIFTVLIQPLLIALLALWMLRAEGGEKAIFVIVGSGMTGLWSSLLFISGNSITRERWSGTLELLVGQPTPIPVIIFGKNLAHVMQSLGSMIVAYLLSSVLFGFQLDLQHPLLFIVSLLLTVMAFVSFGLIIAPVFIMNPGVQGWQNAMEFPVYILSGFLFPIALLPGWTTPLSYFLAPYWAARALHGTTSAGSAVPEILFSLGMLILFSAIYLALSSYLFRKMLVKTREDATLGFQ
ncbi:MAG: ABC transporter permease [Anaerolineales bacterium]